MKNWEKQQKFMFFGIITFAIVCMTLSIVLMITNPEHIYEDGVSDNSIEAAALYQYAFQNIAEEKGEFVKETLVDDLNRHVQPEHALFTENDVILSQFADEYGEKYVLQYVSTEHVRLTSKGNDKQINTSDDLFIDYLVYQEDDILIYEMRTAKLLQCNHDFYDIEEEATCTNAGISQHKCRKCGNAFVKWYPIKEHSFENNVCITCGQVQHETEGE